LSRSRCAMRYRDARRSARGRKSAHRQAADLPGRRSRGRDKFGQRGGGIAPSPSCWPPGGGPGAGVERTHSRLNPLTTQDVEKPIASEGTAMIYPMSPGQLTEPNVLSRSTPGGFRPAVDPKVLAAAQSDILGVSAKAVGGPAADADSELPNLTRPRRPLASLSPLPVAEQRVGLGVQNAAHDPAAIEGSSIAHYARVDHDLGDADLRQRRDRAPVDDPADAGPERETESFSRTSALHHSIARACDCCHYPARGDRGFIDLGANRQKCVAHRVCDRGRWGNGAAFSHAFHAVFGMRGRGV